MKIRGEIFKWIREKFLKLKITKTKIEIEIH